MQIASLSMRQLMCAAVWLGVSPWLCAADKKGVPPDPAKALAAGSAADLALKSAAVSKSWKLPPLGGAPVDPKSYIIGPEDMLAIRVWREPELSGQFPVRPDGKISLPLVNEITAAGLTPEQLSTTIADGLGKFMTHPEVTVGVQQVNSKKYFINGEVQKPGAYPLTVPTTVLEALVNAGGFRDFANTKKIVVLRGKDRHMFNYKDVTHGKHMEQNIVLQSGDQIIVP